MKRRITSLAVALTFLHSQIAYALPVKNNASNGVQFAKNQNTLNITAPDKSVINYDSFNIAANEAVNFVQPGASASVLNRVLSGGASTINGALAANGNVLLVNPSGVMFGGGATVNANSFIASTKNITDANFQAGLLKFEGSTSGTIVNNGLINGSKNVGLIAANIENKGTIKAGKNAGLIAGNTGSVSVDFDGDGLINFTADSSSIGSGTIENSGIIKAGQVLLTANDVSNVLENVINNTGTIEATKAVAGENGAIQLISDASVKNTGNLKAPEGKIIINTGGDMNSEGTISAVDGEVDIEATGDVTSSGTLEAGKLTEKGATFGISGTFSVDESSLKNDDDAIEFTGDTTLTGNISDVDNIIVGGGVTLTLAADVTLTAGADTSSNTNVNDTSNIVTSTGGDFIWMADDAVIDGAGYNLTFDTKGTNSWLSGIVGVNDLTFLNGNADKVSNTVTYELNKDITTTGLFLIGEGTILNLYPMNNASASISDISLTANSFAAAGIGANAGSIKLNNKNLTLDATSTTASSAVNFYVNDRVNDVVYSAGSLTFLGNAATNFNVGVANNDASTGNTIMVKGITLGNTVDRVANVALHPSLKELSAAADTAASLALYGTSKLELGSATTLRGKSIDMSATSSIDANNHALTLLATENSTLGILSELSDLTINHGVLDATKVQYDITGSAINANSLTIGANVKLRGTQNDTVFNLNNLDMQQYSQINAWADVSNPDIDTHNNIILNVTGTATLRDMACIEDLTLKGGGTFRVDEPFLNADGVLSLGEGNDTTDLVLTGDLGITAKSLKMDLESTINGAGNNLHITIKDNSVVSNLINIHDLTFNRIDDPVAPSYPRYQLYDDIRVTGALKATEGTSFQLMSYINLYADMLILSDAFINGSPSYLYHPHAISGLNLYATQWSTLGKMTNLKYFGLYKNPYGTYNPQYELHNDYLGMWSDFTMGNGVRLRCAMDNTTINAQNMYMGSNTQINGWDGGVVHNSLTLHISNSAVLEKIESVQNLTLMGGATFSKSTPDALAASGILQIGVNNDATSLLFHHQYSGIWADTVIMDASSSIQSTSNFYINALNTSTLYTINVADTLTLEGHGATPTSFLEYGSITCNNNNTPIYINAN